MLDWDKSYTITTSTIDSFGSFAYFYSTVIIPEDGYILWQNTSKARSVSSSSSSASYSANCSFYINGKGFTVNSAPSIETGSQTNTFSILVKKDDVIQARGHGSVVFIPLKK